MHELTGMIGQKIYDDEKNVVYTVTDAYEDGGSLVYMMTDQDGHDWRIQDHDVGSTHDVERGLYHFVCGNVWPAPGAVIDD